MLQNSLIDYDRQIADIRKRVVQAQNSALQANMYKIMNDIVNDAMKENIDYDLGRTTEKFELQKYCLTFVDEKLKNSSLDPYEVQALQYVKEFAETKLTPNSYKCTDMFDLIVFKADKDYAKAIEASKK